MARTVIFAASCDVAAEALGGYERIDPALDTVYQALVEHPYGFKVIENDFTRARYLVTTTIGTIPVLVWLFTIDDENNVVLTHVERYEPY